MLTTSPPIPGHRSDGDNLCLTTDRVEAALDILRRRRWRVEHSEAIGWHVRRDDGSMDQDLLAHLMRLGCTTDALGALFESERWQQEQEACEQMIVSAEEPQAPGRIDLPEIRQCDYEAIAAYLKEDARKARRCVRCTNRCDPPHGDGRRCLACASRPTGEAMRMILRGRRGA